MKEQPIPVKPITKETVIEILRKAGLTEKEIEVMIKYYGLEKVEQSIPVNIRDFLENKFGYFNPAHPLSHLGYAKGLTPDIEDLINAFEEYLQQPTPAPVSPEEEEIKILLLKIINWNLPATGKFWDVEKLRPTSYETEYGSNGARDYIRTIAKEAYGKFSEYAAQLQSQQQEDKIGVEKLKVPDWIIENNKGF